MKGLRPFLEVLGNGTENSDCRFTLCEKFSSGVKRQGREAVHSFDLLPVSRTAYLQLHSPKCFNGVVLI
jgi:hypothetical protein